MKKSPRKLQLSRETLTTLTLAPSQLAAGGFAEVYGKLGVTDLHRLRRKRSPAHALS